VLPEPVRVEPGRVCYAGECYSVPLQYTSGRAWWWVKAYRGSTFVVAQEGPEGGSAEPGLNAMLTVFVTRLDVGDQAAGAEPAGIPVKIDGVTYYTDGSGQVRVSVPRGTWSKFLACGSSTGVRQGSSSGIGARARHLLRSLSTCAATPL